MAGRKLKAFWKRPANKFFVSLFAFSVSCWLIYQSLSYLVGPVQIQGDTFAMADKSHGQDGDLIVARIKPRHADLPPDVPNTVMPLLAAAPTAQTAQDKETIGSAPALTRLPEDVRRTLSKARQMISSGKTLSARRLVNEFILRESFDDKCGELIDLALDMGKKTILSDKITPGDRLCSPYTVKRGDFLSRIAKPCKVPYRFISRINGISDPRKLGAGQQIKLVHGPVNAVVVKHKFMIYLYLQDTLFAAYPVGLGKDNYTPSGTWLVQDCVKDPDYRDPDTGQLYDGKDPANPTAGYWIRLKGMSGDAAGKKGFGIHGTIEPESVGKMVSKGCIRMHKKDIADVFAMLRTSVSKVTVLP